MVNEILLTVEEDVGNHRANDQVVVRGNATVMVILVGATVAKAVMVISVGATVVKVVMVILAEATVVMTARRAPEVVGRDVKSLIQRVVGAEVVTSLARVRNQDRKSAELLDPLAFAVAIVLKLQDSVENAESLFECPGFNKRLLVMGVQRPVHR